MSNYKGERIDKGANNAVVMQVTVDGQSLPAAQAEVPGVGEAFGWGGFSPWVNKKLLAYSLLFHELEQVMGLPRSQVHQVLLDIGEPFMNDQVAAFGKEWSLTGDAIQEWIRTKYPRTWEMLTRRPAHA